MDKHWQVIEDALTERHERLMSTLSRWPEGSVIHERRLAEANELYAALAFVREQRAGQTGEWMPVPDGTYGNVDTITIHHNGTVLEIHSAYGDGSRKHHAMYALENGERLCRRVQREDEK